MFTDREINITQIKPTYKKMKLNIKNDQTNIKNSVYLIKKLFEI